MTTTLTTHPATARPDLLARPVAAALAGWTGSVPVTEVEVAAIDPELADTAVFCERHGVSLAESANCVVVAARRGGEVSHAAFVVTATTRGDVNGLIRRHLGARKVSFAPMAEVLDATGMEYGGITPIGLPEGWPILVDSAVAALPRAVVGSGIRGSKLWVPGPLLAELPGAQVLDGLGLPLD
ncbi:YbaK/EbsC family protein [Allostreptomyces psammosilenae]|uniref:Prolyl-tRNA editing enzyme YbaK/EbsC (Cys-tRNA(Pro) deacylase) n=1 Tax=Allostreptomyces psammosilenae TaxID=1892865 RepID=A0A853A8J4_9ACTN|nr:YbaK/EbsC family protein [Allostreptomyces psammosilenae]NYI06752.1 prolyl-tRNA editing enzyme YbaK/EbsC (Cys-tRNA(Pro) deacylase) [Allostreptomyces psammosilenae]